jgi:hypothetical protein
MENPGNCTQTNSYVIHNRRDVPPVEIPKTLVHATNPSGATPDLELLTSLTDPGRLTFTPVTANIPLSEEPIKGVIPEPLTTGIPNLRRMRSDVPPSPVRTLVETADVLTPTSLPLVNRAQDSAPDEWSCMWDVNITLPDFAPRMFDAAFDGATVNEMLLGTQRILEGEVENPSECVDALEEEIQTSLID